MKDVAQSCDEVETNYNIKIGKLMEALAEVEGI